MAKQRGFKDTPITLLRIDSVTIEGRMDEDIVDEVKMRSRVLFSVWVKRSTSSMKHSASE